MYKKLFNLKNIFKTKTCKKCKKLVNFVLVLQIQKFCWTKCTRLVNFDGQKSTSLVSTSENL